jgi:hypothetical protein
MNVNCQQKKTENNKSENKKYKRTHEESKRHTIIKERIDAKRTRSQESLKRKEQNNK